MLALVKWARSVCAVAASIKPRVMRRVAWSLIFCVNLTTVREIGAILTVGGEQEVISSRRGDFQLEERKERGLLD